MLNKLYPNKHTNCPVTFSTRIPARYMGQYQIRARVTYSSLEHVREVVRRCRNDSDYDPELEPLIQCQCPGVTFETKGHHSAILPLDSSRGGYLFLVANFSFPCWNTCPGLKGRPLKLSFALETLR